MTILHQKSFSRFTILATSACCILAFSSTSSAQQGTNEQTKKAEEYWNKLAEKTSDTPVTQDISEADFTSPDADVFSNKMFIGLKKNVTPADIKKMKNPFLRNLAISMKKGTYDAKKRAGAYEAFEPIEILSKRLKTNTYNRFENPTGIYFDSGEKIAVIMQCSDKEKVELKVHDFGSMPVGNEQSYPLKNGVNVIEIKNSGLGYINYYTEDFAKAPKAFANILGGKVNGVFDSTKSTNEDWKKLLDSAVCEVIDIKGKHVQLVYPIKELKEACPDKGLELINLYDRLINSQHEIMGLVKYKRQPKNRMFGRVIWKGFMHADGIGAAFHNGTMHEIANPDKIPTMAWGLSHEFGHVNQTRPGIMWVSTTEVTNNLYSAWANFKLNPTHMRLEHEVIDGGDGNMVGGRFNAFLNSAIVNGEQWLCQRGPDKMQGYEQGGDHFVKLTPLWQLQLYFMEAKKGNPDFLADIFEKIRKESQEDKTNGELQLEFMKNVCDATKQDLSDFFVKTGMLKPIDKDMDDYKRAQLTITEKQCKDLISYAKRYKKPLSPVIYYLSVNSLNAYKKQLPVTGTLNQGISGEGNKRKISHSVWKNVAVFETYQGDKLVKVTMVGTDSPDNTSTTVIYPEGSTSIKAVSWDGKRTPVYSSPK
ncbi:MAG: M60 family metallopeptidase [Akkermansia sp.]